jgi:hypothetical protein
MKKWLVITGSAPCVLDDLASIPDRARFDFMLIGAGSPATLNIRNLAYHVSHENDFAAIRERRGSNGLNTDYETFSNRQHPGVDHVLADLTPPTCSPGCQPRLGSNDPRNHHHYSGSSAMLGLKIALRLGYKKIILAGVPLNKGQYFNFQVGWRWIADLLRCCPVRSMSGFTMEILGKYTEEWLND